MAGNKNFQNKELCDDIAPGLPDPKTNLVDDNVCDLISRSMTSCTDPSQFGALLEFTDVLFEDSSLSERLCRYRWCCGDSFTWIKLLECGTSTDYANGFPLRLILTNMMDDDMHLLQVCLEMLSLIIAEIAAADDEPSDRTSECTIDSMSNDAVSSLLDQLIKLGSHIGNSLSTGESTDHTDIQVNPLALRVLAVYLQWVTHFYKHRILTLSELDLAIFDETVSQPLPPTSEEYQELTQRFERDVWLPLCPFVNTVFRHAFCLDGGVQAELFARCRKHVCSLARLFPGVVVNNLDADFADFLLASQLAKPSHVSESLSCLRDVADLLSTALCVSALVDKTDDSSRLCFKDTCVSVVGKLSFLILDKRNSLLVEALLHDFENSAVGNLCVGCRSKRLAIFAETLSNVVGILLFLTANVWQSEVSILLEATQTHAESLTDVNSHWTIERLCDADLEVLGYLAKLSPSLLDWDFSHLRYYPCKCFSSSPTLRASSSALLRCESLVALQVTDRGSGVCVLKDVDICYPAP
ncbi:unnamed protein product [Mesocestoides corti]|uniref:Uncharacterized protein n=1 Tax=Mesocestoides corti TaxID=53468 RepID=A0A0R3U309_MESCO|nr:unnamed protein product [Mesocestoides corti]